MTLHCMLDLETIGTRPGCSILSIGVVPFGPEGVAVEKAYYRVISRSSCRDVGLQEDPKTLEWWVNQTDEARKVFTEPSQPIGVALHYLKIWFQDYVGPDVLVWGNGADFDLPILAEAYHRAGYGGPPWKPFNGRCYRTLKNFAPATKIVGPVAHNAKADAIAQAEHAVRLMTELKLPW